MIRPKHKRGCAAGTAPFACMRKNENSNYGRRPMPPSSVRVSPDRYLKSGMASCKMCIRDRSKGSVINFASGAGLFGNFGQCSYAAAKEGIRSLSRVAATEWGKDGINVNVICPLAWTAKLEQFQQAYPDAFKANVKICLLYTSRSGCPPAG